MPSCWRRLEVVRARWWWRRNERKRTKVNHDVVDGGLKLRPLLKIAFNINALALDNKIKRVIIL